jgi:hypothetical protein
MERKLSSKTIASWDNEASVTDETVFPTIKEDGCLKLEL